MNSPSRLCSPAGNRTPSKRTKTSCANLYTTGLKNRGHAAYAPHQFFQPQANIPRTLKAAGTRTPIFRATSCGRPTIRRLPFSLWIAHTTLSMFFSPAKVSTFIQYYKTPQTNFSNSYDMWATKQPTLTGRLSNRYQ